MRETGRVNHWLLAAVVLALLGACAGTPLRPESPRVRLVGLEPLAVELLEQRYRVGLRIQNPNDFPLRVRGIDFRIDLNGQRFAEGVSNRHVEVPAFGEARLDVEVSSSLFDLVRQLQSLGRGESRALEYRISGRLALSGSPLRVPFRYEGRIDLAPAGAPGDSGA